MPIMDLCEAKADEIHLNGPLDRETVPNIWKKLTVWKPKVTQIGRAHV